MIDKDLFKLLGKNKKYIFIVVFLMVIGLFANLAFTFSLCYAIEITIDSLEAINYLYAFITAISAVIIRYITSRLVGEIKDVLGRSVKKELREKIYDKIITLGAKSASGMSMAGLTQVSMEGIEQLDLYYCNYLPQFFYAMIAPFVLFGITVGLNWRPAVALIALVPMIPVSIIAVSKYAKKVFAKYWGKYTSMGDSFLDTTQGLKELKIFNADAKRNVKMNEQAEEFRKITMKVLVMQLASSTIMDTVAYGGAGLGIVLTIISITNGWMTPIWNMSSALPVALFIILVSVDFFLPMRQFGSAFHVGMNGASAGKKIIAILNTEDPVWGEETITSSDIKFDNVTFSYDGKKNVLKNINLDFTKGMNAIVGESGCGKSTIVNLLLGQNRVNEGVITIGGKNIESLSRVAYFSRLSVVSYNTYIFNESVRENFKMAKPDVNDGQIYEALKKVNLYNFIVSEGGLDKIIYEDSENISGGQRQRLALAINLVAPKDIYVFDEATSNIDVDSEKIIMDVIKELSKDSVVIFISHRLANVIDADTIAYLEEGVITEKGTHEELMALKGGYHQMFVTQKSLEEGFKEVVSHAE